MAKYSKRTIPIREYFKFKDSYWHSAQTLDAESRLAYYDAVVNMGLCGILPDEDKLPDGAYHAWMDQKWRLTTSVKNHKNGLQNKPKNVDFSTGEITDDTDVPGWVAPPFATSQTASETISETTSERASQTVSDNASEFNGYGYQPSQRTQPFGGVHDSVTGRLRDPNTGLFIDD